MKQSDVLGDDSDLECFSDIEMVDDDVEMMGSDEEIVGVEELEDDTEIEAEAAEVDIALVLYFKLALITCPNNVNSYVMIYVL